MQQRQPREGEESISVKFVWAWTGGATALAASQFAVLRGGAGQRRSDCDGTVEPHRRLL